MAAVPNVMGGIRVVAADSRTLLDDAIGMLDGARRSLHVETFAMSDTVSHAAFARASSRGLAGTIVVDAEKSTQFQGIGSDLLDVVTYGSTDHKVHSKLLVADDLASVLTAAATSKLRSTPHLDFRVELPDELVPIARELVESAASEDPARIAAAAEDAARVGLLVNDPRFGIYHLRRGLNGLADNAVGDAWVATKVLNDHKLLRRMQSAVRSTGGRVMVETMGGTQGKYQVERAAKFSGAKVRMLPGSPIRLHGNAVLAADELGHRRMIVMSSPLTKRGLGRDGAPRMGRELGVAFDDPAAIDAVLAGAADLSRSRASKFRV